MAEFKWGVCSDCDASAGPDCDCFPPVVCVESCCFHYDVDRALDVCCTCDNFEENCV